MSTVRRRKRGRAFTLLEMLTVVSMIGTLLLIEGTLFGHFFKSMSRRGKTSDQLPMVSVVSDKIRSDLNDERARVVRVEPDRLVIESGNANFEYRSKKEGLERYETSDKARRLTGVWKVPYANLAFSHQAGKGDKVLVELHWSLGRPRSGQNVERALAFQMDFAAKGKENKAAGETSEGNL